MSGRGGASAHYLLQGERGIPGRPICEPTAVGVSRRSFRGVA